MGNPFEERSFSLAGLLDESLGVLCRALAVIAFVLKYHNFVALKVFRAKSTGVRAWGASAVMVR